MFTKSTLGEQTTPAALALTDVSKGVSAVSFGDLDLDANQVGGDVSWTPPASEAGIVPYETYLATDAAGSARVLAGGVAVGTNEYAVSSDADGTGKSHIVEYMKYVLVEQATPAALAQTDKSLSVSGVSSGELDLDALQIGGGLSSRVPALGSLGEHPR